MKKIHQTLSRCSGQSTVEYIILVAAVMAVVLIFLNGKNSAFQQRLNSTLEETSNDVTDRGSALFSSHTSPNGPGAAPSPQYDVNMQKNPI